MLEKRLLSIYALLDAYSEMGWVPMKSKDEEIFFIFSPSKNFYSSGFPNNPLKKENPTKEEKLAKEYLHTLIEYQNLIKLFPENYVYSIAIKEERYLNTYKLIKHSIRDVQ
jgi:hypothetical protein